MKDLVILGSTGSIGRQSLEVAQKCGFKVSALAAGSDIKLLEIQARKFLPECVAVADEKAAKELRLRLKDTNIKVLSGQEGVMSAASDYGDTVISAIVGIAGLLPTLTAISAGKTIALANKETLVTAGKLVKAAAKEKNVKLIPVDSEHSAIFQSLQGVKEKIPKKIILTASGGPFFGKTKEELRNVTVEQALNHPNWSMGAKITVDSATLMNKGLEVIEAVHLFGVKAEAIEVVVHRQSILHSAVELNDGAVIAQLGTPDMRLPIQYALTYPERKECFERLDLFKVKTLTFEKPDTDTFKCLPLCIEAINRGGLYPAAINGANEESVKLFLEGKIKFTDIEKLNGDAMLNAYSCDNYTVDDVFETDRAAREFVRSHF